MRPESAGDPSLQSPQPKLSPDVQRNSHTALHSPGPLLGLHSRVGRWGHFRQRLGVYRKCSLLPSQALPFLPAREDRSLPSPDEALGPQIQNPQLENAPRTLQGVFKHATPMAWCTWSASSVLFWPLRSPWLEKSLQEREPQSSPTKCLDLSWPPGFFLLMFFQA